MNRNTQQRIETLEVQLAAAQARTNALQQELVEMRKLASTRWSQYSNQLRRNTNLEAENAHLKDTLEQVRELAQWEGGHKNPTLWMRLRRIETLIENATAPEVGLSATP